MNRRIKHVWIISIVAMITIFAMQAYWLYNQYEYSSMVKAEELKAACTKAFETEKDIRIDKYDDIKYNNSNVRMKIVLKIDQNIKNRKEKKKSVKSTIRFTLPDTKKQLKVKNIDMTDGVELTSRYMVSQNRRFDHSTFDSLLYTAEGIKTDRFRFVKTNRCMVKPVFTMSDGLIKTLYVKYSTNPLNMEAVEMAIPIPVSQTLILMGWQFAASVVLLVILGFCMMYQIKTIMIQDEKGEPLPVYSIASGLDYPGSGPQHCYLHDIKRVTYTTITDREAVEAFYALSRMEGIIPALESSHAVAYAVKLAEQLDKDQTILVNLSGRGDKDIDFVMQNYPLVEYEPDEDAVKENKYKEFLSHIQQVKK